MARLVNVTTVSIETAMVNVEEGKLTVLAATMKD